MEEDECVLELELTTDAKVAEYHTVFPLFSAMFEEFSKLSKKKPEAVANKSKIKIVNRILEKARFILECERELEYLDLLDEDDLPQFSDVTLVLSQYGAALKAYKSRYYKKPAGSGILGPAEWMTE